MTKKYNEFLNEKLSDKLSGFNEEDLKQQFLNGVIKIEKFFEIIHQYNIPRPSNDEIKQAIDNLFYNGKIVNFAFYFNY